MFSDVLMNKDVRIDSSFYTTKIYKNESLKYEKIKEILISTQYGVSIDMNENKDGYPIYRMNEIHNMLCDTAVSKYAKLSKEEFIDFKLNNEDVLFNRTNSYEFVGRTGIYYDTKEDKIFASYLVRFIPNKKYVLPEYLTAFLNSKYGQIDIKRHSRQSINQTNVNPEEVKEIEIPILKQNLQEKIRECFVNANKQRIKSEQLFTDAEEILNKELGFDNIEIPNETISIINFSEYKKQNRLDAEYYQPKYEYISELLKKYKKGFAKLSEISTIYRGNLISDDLYCNDNNCKAYIRGADISSNILVEDKIVYINNSFEHTNEIKCELNDIVFALIGSVGTLARVTEQFVDSYISNNLGLIRLNSNKILAEYLHLLLSSKKIGKLLFEQQEMKTAQPKISDKNIVNFPIPLLDIKVQQKIAEKIQESFKLRKQSKDLLDLAKQVVETAIEKNENAALKLINNYISKKDEYLNNYNKDIPMAAEDMDEFKSKN